MIALNKFNRNKMINEKIGEIERYLYNMYWIYIF